MVCTNALLLHTPDVSAAADLVNTMQNTRLFMQAETHSFTNHCAAKQSEGRQPDCQELKVQTLLCSGMPHAMRRMHKAVPTRQQIGV
jgi:hypothetical protein